MSREAGPADPLWSILSCPTLGSPPTHHRLPSRSFSAPGRKRWPARTALRGSGGRCAAPPAGFRGGGNARGADGAAAAGTGERAAGAARRQETFLAAPRGDSITRIAHSPERAAAGARGVRWAAGRASERHGAGARLGRTAGSGGPRGGGGARLGSAGPGPPVGPLVVRPLLDNGAAIRKGAEPRVPHPRPAAAPWGSEPPGVSQRCCRGRKEGDWDAGAVGRGRGASPSSRSWRNKSALLGLKVFRR